MDYQEAYENLKNRALKFHAFLSEYGVYREDVSEDRFLELVEDQIASASNALESGRGDPWVTVFAFPVGLTLGIRHQIYHSGFDVMESPKEFYEALKDILSQRGYEFDWHFDEDQELLRFNVEDIEWEVECKNLRFIEEPISHSKIEPNLSDFLEKQGLYLFPITTGDAIGEYILIPIEAKDAIKEFLVPAFGSIDPEFDPRGEWLYSGIPEDKRPENLWDI